MQSRYDVIVVGGGISGLGVAWEAARHGFTVRLLESRQCCSAASASSLRIIHGGLRYLQHLELTRVVESLKEQDYLLKSNSDLITRLPCLLPLSAWGMRSPLPMQCAAALYNCISRLYVKQANGCRIVDKSYVEKYVSRFGHLAPHGALLWYDALLLDPHAMSERLKLRIQEEGGEVAEGVAVAGIERGPGGELTVQTSTGPLSAAVVVNTSGAWLPRISSAVDTGRQRQRIGWCKAFNLVLKQQLDNDHAFGIHGEGRFYFFVPRGGRTALGTWYIPYDGRPEEVKVSEEEVQEFLSSASRAAAPLAFTLNDVAEIEVGVLPMLSMGKNGPRLFGAQKLFRKDGLVEVLSTKYTTFRSQARQALRAASPYLVSGTNPKNS